MNRGESIERVEIVICLCVRRAGNTNQLSVKREVEEARKECVLSCVVCCVETKKTRRS